MAATGSKIVVTYGLYGIRILVNFCAVFGAISLRFYRFTPGNTKILPHPLAWRIGGVLREKRTFLIQNFALNSYS